MRAENPDSPAERAVGSSSFSSGMTSSSHRYRHYIEERTAYIVMASKRPEYVIEHMEEDDPDAPSVFPEWALLEVSRQRRLHEAWLDVS